MARHAHGRRRMQMQQMGSLSLPVVTGLTADFDSRFGFFQDTLGATPAVSDGDAIGLWRDQSGNGRDMSQGSGSLKGTLRLGAINGFPAMELAASDYVAGLAASNYITNTAFTWYVVFKADTIGTNVTTAGSIYTNHSLLAVGGGYGGLVLLSGTPSLYLYNDTPPEVSVNRDITTGAWYVAFGKHSAGNIYASVGNGAEASAVSGNTGVLTGPLQIGAPAGGGSQHKVARVLIYNTDHDSDQKDSVMDYLNALYGVAV